jgi:hypothetical protein
MSWQQDSIVVPSTQLELEDNHADWLCAADQDAPDSPPWVGDDEDGSCDPPSLSRTPSGDLLALAHWQDSTSAPQETWSQYSGTIFDEHRVPIEAQLSGQVRKAEGKVAVLTAAPVLAMLLLLLLSWQRGGQHLWSRLLLHLFLRLWLHP